VGVLLLVAVAGALGVKTHLRNRDYHSELTMWRDIARKSPHNPRAHHSVAVVLQRQGRHDAAIERATRSLELIPSAEAYYTRGVSRYERGGYEAALADHTRALGIDPRAARAYNNRGNAHAALGRYEQAVSDFTAAVSLEPELAEAWFNRGNAFRSLGRPHRALADYTRAIRLRPRYVEARNNRASVYLELRMLRYARGDIEKCLELAPDAPEVLGTAAAVELQAGRPPAALDYAQRAVATGPNHAPAYRARAWAWYANGQRDRAREDLQTMLRLGGEPDPALTRRLEGAATRPE
jgi:tetratricopeptide (TPR) repeat protein